MPGSDQPPDAVVTDKSQYDVDQAYSGGFASDGGGFGPQEVSLQGTSVWVSWHPRSSKNTWHKLAMEEVAINHLSSTTAVLISSDTSNSIQFTTTSCQIFSTTVMLIVQDSELAALLATVLVPAAAAAETTPGSDTSVSQQQVARRGSAATSVDSCAADHIAVVFQQLAKEQWAAVDIVRFYKGVAWPTMLAIGRCRVKAKSLQSSMPVSAEDWLCLLQAVQKAAY